jgi:hypothetical protein
MTRSHVAVSEDSQNRTPNRQQKSLGEIRVDGQKRSRLAPRRAAPIRCPKAIVDCRGLNDNPRNSIDRVFFEGVAKTGGSMVVSALDAVMTCKRKDAPRAETGPFPPGPTSLDLCPGAFTSDTLLRG